MTIEREVPRFDPNRQGEPQVSKWLLLFYLAGDSMLSASMISQLKELTDAGFHKDATVLAYFDPNCNGLNARIFNVNELRKQSRKAAGLTPTLIGDGRDPYVRNIAEDQHVRGLEQMTASDSLAYFLKQATTDFRAENYMLFLMGHGTIVGNDAFLPHPTNNSAITLKQLGETLNQFAADVRGSSKDHQNASVKGEFHLVGLHSCAMSSVELAYELQGTARFMIGTQGMAFPGSWPYRQLLKKIFCKIEKHEQQSFAGDPYPNQLVKDILSGIQNLSFYNGEDFWQAGYSSDLSLCSLEKDKVRQLDRPLNKLVMALTAGLKTDHVRTGIVMAHWESQSYWNESYTDLYDFCDRLERYCADDSAITGASRYVKCILEDKPHDFDNLVVFSDYFGPNYQFSHGLSIYFPWALPGGCTMKTYGEYAFTKLADHDGAWATFLDEYFKGTLRPMRGSKPGDDRAPGKVGPPPDKPPGMGGPPPDKAPAMGNVGPPPDKAPAMGNVGPPPDKAPAMGNVGPPPDKPPAMGQPPPIKLPALAGPPPDKPPAYGSFGATIIKNYFESDEVDITSRPWSAAHIRPVANKKVIEEHLNEERDD